MDPETLANRLVNYCDGVVAFALINSAAFLAALAEPDIRASIGGQPFFFIGAIVSAAIQTAILIALRRAELSLRGGSEGALDERVRQTLRALRIGRYALVWLGAALTIALGTVVSFDPLVQPH
jgi:hypothetical protein